MKKVLEILREIRPDVDFMKVKVLTEEGLLDSLDIIRLASELEKNFGIVLNGSDIISENFRNLTSIETLVARLRAKK